MDVGVGVGDELQHAGLVEFAVELVLGELAGAVDQGAGGRGDRQAVVEADVAEVKGADAVDVEAGLWSGVAVDGG
ncbi:MAG TPA: hypothetical protein VHX62_01915, partial [Solirubrobacteraceae bacterium]|nr:hypothetical protein [Solirubrobacteraceae bacterium]